MLLKINRKYPNVKREILKNVVNTLLLTVFCQWENDEIYDPLVVWISKWRGNLGIRDAIKVVVFKMYFQF